MPYTANTVIEKLAIKQINKYPNKPTLVFLHDSFGCIELWADFPEKLTETVQCNAIIYDRLGYGKSEAMISTKRENNYLEFEAEVLNALLKKLDIKDAILFGHSDGGSIALIAASKFPQRIKSIIIEAAHIFVEEITVKGIYQAIDEYKNSNLRERLQKYHANKTDTVFESWANTWTSNEFKIWNIEHFLPNITCPLLFIQGENDEYGSIAQVDKTVNQVHGKSEKYIIQNTGHTPHKKAQNLVLEKTAKFIKSEISKINSAY